MRRWVGTGEEYDVEVSRKLENVSKRLNSIGVDLGWEMSPRIQGPLAIPN